MVNLFQLFKIHEVMENYIKSTSDILEDALGSENIFDLRYLALQVKVGELANLTKCYKYARIKDNLPKDKLMARYIDALKFLLSIGNVNNYNVINIESVTGANDSSSIIKVFADIFDYITEVRTLARQNNYYDSLNAYMKLFGEFIKLAEGLGFTMEEVYQSYQEMVCQITQAC